MSFPKEIILDEADQKLVEKYAKRREKEAVKKGYKHRFNNPFGNDGMSQHIMGCQGEVAVCKFLKIPWSKSVNLFHRGPDIAYRCKGFEVRTRDGNLHPCAIVKPRDNHYQYLWAVTAFPPKFIIEGWIKIGDAKEMKEYYDDRDKTAPIWRIPLDKLEKDWMP